MIKTSKYKAYEQEMHNFVTNMYYNFIDIYGYKPTPLHEFFKLKDAVVYSDVTHELKFKVGQYLFFTDIEIRLTERQPGIIIKTFEDVQQTARKTDYDSRKILHIKELDMFFDSTAWKLAIKPDATNILVLYCQLLTKYIERVETDKA